MNFERIVWLKLRFVMSFIFLWAFFDKTFGLHFLTSTADTWVNGGSPTLGFLMYAVKGPLASVFKSMAGVVVVDWLFMLGLLFVGLTLLLNKYIKWGAITGGVMMFLIWLSMLLPENNPIIDEHVVYILVLSLLAIESKKGKLR